MGINEYLKTADAGKEKHVPEISVAECNSCGGLRVRVIVGKEVLHPSTPEHSIKTIAIYGVTNEAKIDQLAVFQLGDENTKPLVRASIVKDKYAKLLATSYCNLHGLWENSFEL